MAPIFKARREGNRAYNARTLRAAGVAFTELSDGWQFRIERNGEIIDFMPSTGTWSIGRDRCSASGTRRGVRALIHYLATGEVRDGQR